MEKDLDRWYNEAVFEYEKALRRDDIQCPRDLYLALYVGRKVEQFVEQQQEKLLPPVFHDEMGGTLFRRRR